MSERPATDPRPARFPARRSWPWLLVGLVLAAARCAPAPATSGGDGEPCEWGLECAGEVCLQAEVAGAPTGFRDGLCTRLCTVEACPFGTWCTDLIDARYCLPACIDGAQCRDGYVCHSLLKVCFPDCRADLACGTGLFCQPDGECRGQRPPEADAVGPGDGVADDAVVADAFEPPPIGAPCTTDAVCRGARCQAELRNGQPTGWTDGTCTIPCPHEGCPLGTSCLAPPEPNAPAMCLTACNGRPRDPICREGYICDPQAQVCLPDCRNPGRMCPPGLTCRPSGACQGPGMGR